MIKSMLEKIKSINTKNKLTLSIIALFLSTIGGISIAIIIKDIISLFIMLAVALNLDFLLEKYNNYKKKYCYELSEEYLKKFKNDIDKTKVKAALKNKVEQNKLWNSLFIGSIPLSTLIALILFCSNVGLITSLTCAGAIIFTSLPITILNMEYTSFGIDVLCEVIEKIENSGASTELANIEKKPTTFEETMSKLTYNTGISQYRYKYVPEAIKTNHIDTEIIVHDKNNFTGNSRNKR